ncbi:MAG: 8-hydroxy-5-deazaflavin:NADPH oxidoreductase [Blastocatellia bacterium]|jgi:predicted dinucleotide-binding enzyme|nr:8-hydroxy-5-deazaflavin:NADPH oxidoreductase [Blastocatellia bacterium]
MKIGIVGSGNIGANAARLFVRAGHEVVLSNSRGGQGLEALVAELGAKASAGTIEEASGASELVLIAIPFGKFKTLPERAFDGKVVIDAGNYYPDRDGKFVELDNDQTTSSELMSSHLKGARLIKGFNTIWFKHLASQGDTTRPLEDRRAIFIAGDDSGAKEIVARLIEEIGFAAVDTGFLHEGGRSQQPGTAVYNKDVTAKEAALLSTDGIIKEESSEHAV